MCIYRGEKYYVLDNEFGGVIEIAPTRHGAGSFFVHVDFVEFI